MTDKEILIAKLTIFLKKYGAYDAYIAGLSEHGAHGKTIDKLAEWCINQKIESDIIMVSFRWMFVERDSTYTWGGLHSKFKENYHSLPYESIVDEEWDNMWEH